MRIMINGYRRYHWIRELSADMELQDMRVIRSHVNYHPIRELLMDMRANTNGYARYHTIR